MSKRTISISRRTVRRVTFAVLIPLVIVGLVYLGRSVTPRDKSGAPLMLSPSLKAMLAYRAQARQWVERLRDLDTDLTALLSEDRDIYYQTEAANDLLDRGLGLAQEIEVSRAPAALAGLRQLLAQTSLAYLDTTRAAADWVGAPLPENEQGVLDLLGQARALLAQVEESRWLQEPEVQAADEHESDVPSGTPAEGGEGEEWWTP